MTSTSTAATPPNPTPTPALPRLRLNSVGGNAIILMTSLSAGTVVCSTDGSLPVGVAKTDWANTAPYYGTVSITETY